MKKLGEKFWGKVALYAFIIFVIWAAVTLDNIWAQGAPPTTSKFKQVGDYLVNKAGDSVGIVTAADTIWFSANGVTVGDYRLPLADGNNTQVLTTNGSGVVSWNDQTGAGTDSATIWGYVDGHVTDTASQVRTEIGDSAEAHCLPLTGGTLTGGLTMFGGDIALGGNNITGNSTSRGTFGDLVVTDSLGVENIKAETLQVYSAFTGGATGPCMRLDGVDVTSGSQFSMRWTYSGASNKIQFTSDSSAHMMVFDTRNDRIGVYETSPAYTFDITGDIGMSGDLYVLGDDIFATTNTSGAVWVGDGTNYNPVVVSNDIAIATDGSATIQEDAIEFSMIGQNSATTNQIPKWNGTAWVAATDEQGTGGTISYIQEGGAANCDSISTANFQAGFDVTESPAYTANISLDLSELSDAIDSAQVKAGSIVSSDIKDGSLDSNDIKAYGVATGDLSWGQWLKVTDSNTTLTTFGLLGSNAAFAFNGAVGFGTSVSVGTDLTVTDDMSADSGYFTEVVAGGVHIDNDSSVLSEGEASDTYLPLAGGTISGDLNMGSQDILALDSVDADDITVNRAYIDTLYFQDTLYYTDGTNTCKRYYDTSNSTWVEDCGSGTSVVDSAIVAATSYDVDTTGTDIAAALADRVTDANLTDTLNRYYDTTTASSHYLKRSEFADSADNHMDTSEVVLIINDSAANVEAALEAVLDLPDLQGTIDSANVTDDGLAEADVNWSYEWIYLTAVHGFARPLEDSIWLYSNVQYGDTLLLAVDTAGDITANDQDTVSVSGYVSFPCTIDSLEIMYMTGAEIVDVYFNGPDLSTPSGLCDSNYWASATDLTSATWDTAQYTFAANVSASAGDRYSFKYIVNFGADNERLRVGWIRMRVKR